MKGKIVFMGTPDFAVGSLDAIVNAGYEVAAVVTVPDRQSGRGLKLTASPVKEYALQHHLPILQPEKMRDPAFLEALKAYDADIFVVVAFRMLPKIVWAMPPMGTFNLHASLLPQYRGAAPINHAIINGERRSGVTTFLLNENIDEGMLLMQQETAISDEDTAETLHDRLASIGSTLVVETLDGLFSGTLKPYPQPLEEPLHPAPKIFKEDCAINWNLGGQEIYNFVRGLSPYPAATATMTNDKGEQVYLKIFKTEYEKAPSSHIGTIISNQKNELKIEVKDGFIKILQLQMSGRKKISVEEFLRGYNVSAWKLMI